MKNKGIIPINKPNGWTSFDVVNKIKYMVKPLKVGHLGTLDPMATGVLLVTIGKATKLFDILQEKKKTYIAEFEFGVLTDTLDSTGEVINRCEVKQFSQEDILKAISCCEGEIMQIPPRFSAKSVNGVRAYTMARKNIDFELPAKKVVVYEIKLLDYEVNSIKLEITCGSGTYIRAIGRDIAEKLNTYLTMTSLVRTKVGEVEVNNCVKISNIDKENVFDFVNPINDILNYEEISLSKEEQFKLLNGQIVDVVLDDGIYKLNNEIDTIALIEIKNFKAKMWLFLGE